MADERDLIEEITARVLADLAGKTDESCPDCRGGCAANCSEKVRSVVANGATRVSYQGAGEEVPADLARWIDHTLLRPDATAAQIDRLCDEARQFGFASVCVNPVWVRRAVANLKGSAVRVTSVVGFPLGAQAPEIKAFEARRALRDGAREIDMVLNIGALKGKDYEAVRRDIARVAEACREVGAVCKVILETGLLSDEEKVIASQLARAAKAHFVKTSTGFGHGGATVYDVALMREAVGPEMGVKASGGIKSAEDIRNLVAAGATRIGASAGVEIVSKSSGNDGRDGSGRY